MDEQDSGSKHPALLREAIADAELLLAFAAKNRSTLTEGLAEQLIGLIVAARTRSLSAEEEGKFWTFRHALSTCLCPVTIDSVKATTLIQTRRWPRDNCTQARVAESKYRYGAMVVLILLLLFQVYWIVGSSVIVEIKKTAADFSELNIKKTAAESNPDAADDNQKAMAALATVQDLTAKIATLETRQDANFELLQKWASPFEKYVACSESKVKCHQKNEARFQLSLIGLDILQRYLLSLLYGALGACVFVLRNLSAEIKASTYSGDSDIRFRSRLYLGALGGMVIAWFVTGNANDGLLQSLSPFALAFVAGYGVDILFTAMDKVVSAFASAPPSANSRS